MAKIYTWASAQSGLWNTPANWTANSGFPDSDNSSSDSVLIGATGAAYTITYAQTTSSNTIGALNITSANANLLLGANSSLTDEGALSLTAGTITVSATATLTDNSNTTAPVVGGLLNVNGGVVDWTGSTGASENTGGIINVSAGGNLTIDGHLNQGGGTVIVSSGTLVASDDFLTTGGSIDVANSGSLGVSGTLSLAGGDLLEIDSGGTVTVGGTLTVDGLVETQSGIGTIDWNTLAGTGTIEANGGTLDVLALIESPSPVAFWIENSAASNLTFSGVQAGLTINFAGSSGQVSMKSVQTFSPDTIVGLHAGSSKSNFIDLLGQSGITATGSGTSATGTIKLSSGGTFDLSGITNFASGWTVKTISDGNGGTDVYLGSVCYAAGSRILTAEGERMIESLMEGDMVLTLSGEELVPQPIKWLGRRRIDIASHPQPETVAPIRIQRGAVADDMPHTDLLVSPDHAILIDGLLICARQLVNGTTIRQENDLAFVDYLHIELKSHAILLAEGLPAESYLDTGNRGFFANANEPLVLHPDLTDEADYPTREAASCASFVWDEGRVRPIWQRLAERAASLSQPAPELDTTTNPELCIVTKAGPVGPMYAGDGRYVFAVPEGTTEVRVISRAGRPTDTRPWLEDRRCLGVCVERIVLRRSDEILEVPVDHPGLSRGWWAVEPNGVMQRRWTNGDAILPLPAYDGLTIMEIRAGIGGMTYVTNNEQHLAA